MAEKKTKKAKTVGLPESSQARVSLIVDKLKSIGVDVEIQMMDLTIGLSLPVYYINSISGSNYRYIGIAPASGSSILFLSFSSDDIQDIFEQDWVEINDFDSFVRAYINDRSPKSTDSVIQQHRTSTDKDDDNGRWISHKDPLLDYAVENKMISTRKEIKRIETVFYVL